MIKYISRIFSCFTLTIFIASSTFFSGLLPVQAYQLTSDESEENPMGIIIEESGDALGDSKTSGVPDLGDDQAFPFIPGFGKNSGKD